MKEEASSVGVEHEAEPNPALRSFYIWVNAFSLLRLTVWLSGIAAIAYCAIALPIKYSAGQQTSVRFLVEIITNLRLHVIIPYTAAASFFMLWRRERYLRKTTVRREHTRLEEFEKRLDPNRTSSQLNE